MIHYCKQSLFRFRELIHLKGDYSPISEGFDTVSGVRYFYNMNQKEYPRCRREISSFFDSLREQTAGMSAFEAEKYVYDLMFDSIVYNENTEHSGSVYGALIEHNARCEGISKAFAWCMNELDIGCITIAGTPLWENTSIFSSHSWNIVCLDGVWYHVDLTADDLKTSPDEHVIPLYSFLNSNDETIRATHLPSQIFTDMGLPSCSSEELNYHVMYDLVLTPEDDTEKGLFDIMDRYYKEEGEVFLRVRFTSADSYNSFTDVWESLYNSYLVSHGLPYRYATLFYNDVGKSVCIHIDG